MSVAELTADEIRNPGWLPVGRASDVPLLEGRGVEVAGRRIAVFRLLHGWAALDRGCPHRGGPLSDGIVADDCVTCPLHNQRFSVLTGERQDGDGDPVATYEIRERDGVLELNAETLGAGAGADADVGREPTA